ncbi:MAG: DUF998 domain-containing protein [Nocardioides sp.]
MSAISVNGFIHPHADRATLRWAGTAGMLMLPFFALTVVALTWLEWDFLHSTGWTVLDEHEVNYPSALARGDLGALQSLNFLLVGVFAAAFAQGLRTQFTHRWSGLVASIALAAVAVSGILSAFPTDLPSEEATWHGLLHGIGFLLMMLGSAVAFVASGLALRSAPPWRGYWIYSLMNVPLALGVTIALSPWGQPSFYGLVVVVLAWYGVMGARLRRLADAPAPMPG